jgi:hypothetical protein
MNSASELIKNVVETLGILCAGAWAISTFWYQDRYVPSKLPVQLDVSTELSDIGRKNGLHALKAHVKLKNSGRRTVYSVASWYNVEAFKIDPALKGPAADTEYYVGVVKEALPKPGTAYSPGRHRRFYSEQDPLVCANGALLAPGYWFDTSEEASSDFVLYVPDDSDSVRFTAAIQITSAQSTYTTEWKVDPRAFLSADAKCPSKCAAVFVPTSTAELSFWQAGK